MQKEPEFIEIPDAQIEWQALAIETHERLIDAGLSLRQVVKLLSIMVGVAIARGAKAENREEVIAAAARTLRMHASGLRQGWN